MDKDAARRRENKFLSYAGDAAAVYRSDAGELADRSEPLERARLAGKSPIASGYDLISTGPIMQGVDALAILDEYRATGFAKSGDVVAFKQTGVVTCWYVDHLAYSKLPGLLNNHLAAAEMSVEGNYNQIDGIINNGSKATAAELEQQARSGQPISLTDLAEATHRERGEKKSVLAKLNAPPPKQGRKKTAPKKSAEKER